MGSKRNPVLDYMAKQKNIPRPSPAASKPGSRFSSQTVEASSRNWAAFSASPGADSGSETEAPSSPETHSDAAQQSHGVPETESTGEMLSRMELKDLLDSPGTSCLWAQ